MLKISSLCLGMLAFPLLAGAQDFLETSSRTKPGELLAVLGVDGQEVRGRVVAITPDTLTLEIGGTRTTIAARTTARIQRRDSIRNGMLIGAIAGGAVGIASGAVLYSICANEGGGCEGALIAISAIGIGGGALIGAGLDGLQHKVIYDDGGNLRFNNDVSREVFGSLAWGRVDSRGSANATPNMGAGWGAHLSNGFGVEFDITRSVGQSRRAVSCVQLRFDPNSPCLGEGAHVLESVMVASAKMSYTFMRTARVQPFVTGGAGFATYRQRRSVATQPGSRTFGTFDPTKPVNVVDAGFGDDGLVGVFGGGVRVPLTRSLALRTEVTVHPLATAADASLVRGSVGFGYRW